MNISDIPWYDRPYQRLIKYGAGSLTDAELLMVILGNIKSRNVLEFTNRLLKKYNFHKLYDLGFESLKKECYGDEYAALIGVGLGNLVYTFYIKPLQQETEVL